jgi:hypothetical protein
MLYTNNIDLTKHDEGKRKYIPNGNKVVHKCPKCNGEIICWEEDTVFKCSIHNLIPIIIPYENNKNNKNNNKKTPQ